MEVRQFLEMAEAYVHLRMVMYLILDLDEENELTATEFIQATDQYEPICYAICDKLRDGVGDVAKAFAAAGHDTDHLLAFDHHLGDSSQEVTKVFPTLEKLRWQLQAVSNAPSTSARDWRIMEVFNQMLVNLEIDYDEGKRRFLPFAVWEHQIGIKPFPNKILEGFSHKDIAVLRFPSKGGNEYTLAAINPLPYPWYENDIAEPIGRLIAMGLVPAIPDPTPAYGDGYLHHFHGAAAALAKSWPIPLGQPKLFTFKDCGQSFTAYQFPSVRMVAAAFIVMMFSDTLQVIKEPEHVHSNHHQIEPDWSIVLDSWRHAARLLNMNDAKPERKLRQLLPDIDKSLEGKRTFRVRLDTAFLTDEQKRQLRTV